MITLTAAGRGRLAILLADEPEAVASVMRSLLNVREPRGGGGFFLPVHDLPMLRDRLDRLGITQVSGRRDMDDEAARLVGSYLAALDRNARIRAGELNDEIARDLTAVKSTLWVDQIADVRFCVRHARVGVFSEMGSGKTAVALASFAVLVARGLARYGLVIAPNNVKQTWLRQVSQHTTLRAVELGNGHAAVLRAIAKAAARRTDLTIIHYEALRDRDVRDRLVELPFDVVIADECFVGSTTVSTPTGSLRIDSLKRGDLVITHDGSTQRVEESWSRPAPELFRLVLGNHRVYCTGNHPFLTRGGWRRADAIKIGEEVVCLVQGEADRPDAGQSFLWDELFGKVADGPAGDPGKISYARASGETIGSHYQVECQESGIRGRIISPDDRAESDARSKDQREGIGDASSQWLSPRISGGRQGWQRQASTKTTGQASGSAGVGLRIHSPDETDTPNPLQDRHRQPEHEGSGGSRWGITQQLEGTGGGRAQDHLPGVYRLARVASVERGCAPPDGYDGRVYNLQVGGSHTYLVDGGVVVHNCHRCKNLDTGTTKALFDTVERIRPAVELVEAEVELADGTTVVTLLPANVKVDDEVEFL